MSSIGKFFLIGNLALAAVFLGAAASFVGSADEWRTKHDDLQANMAEQVKGKETEIANLKAQNGQLTTESDGLKREKQNLSGQLQDATAALTTEKQKNADLTESLNGINAKLGDLEQTNRAQSGQIQEMARQVDQLRTERDGALDERDSAVATATQASETAQLAESRIADLSGQVARLTDDKESAESRFLEASKYYGFDPKDFGGGQPLDLEGLVLDASYEGPGPIVVLNIGKNQRVRPGYTFDVYGGSYYKGRVRVDTVNENNSAGTVILEGNARIAAGDRVKTQL